MWIHHQNGLIWEQRHPRATPGMLGSIPEFLSAEDLRPAKEQFGAAYIGGWHPMPGFKMDIAGRLLFRGDPPMYLLAEAKLRDETIRIYDRAWVAIVQPDEGFETWRMD